jgi:hypothetical protein
MLFEDTAAVQHALHCSSSLPILYWRACTCRTRAHAAAQKHTTTMCVHSRQLQFSTLSLNKLKQTVKHTCSALSRCFLALAKSPIAVKALPALTYGRGHVGSSCAALCISASAPAKSPNCVITSLRNRATCHSMHVHSN